MDLLDPSMSFRAILKQFPTMVKHKLFDLQIQHAASRILREEHSNASTTWHFTKIKEKNIAKILVPFFPEREFKEMSTTCALKISFMIKFVVLVAI
jgi:hypothetical protein